MTYPVDFQQLDVGDSLPPLTKEPVTKLQLVRYAGASGDFNPIHTDDEAARQAGLQGVIAQGILVMGFVGQAITTWVPLSCLRRFKARFTAMTFPGDVITVKATVAEKSISGNQLTVSCHTEARDQAGDIKVAGEFELQLPTTSP
jgi:acyl dehydratase